MPTDLKWMKNSFDKVRLWHMSAGLSFQNYDSLLKTGQLIECSDGYVRDCVYVLAEWLGDGPEIACLNCNIQVIQLFVCCVSCVCCKTMVNVSMCAAVC